MGDRPGTRARVSVCCRRLRPAPVSWARPALRGESLAPTGERRAGGKGRLPVFRAAAWLVLLAGCAWNVPLAVVDGPRAELGHVPQQGEAAHTFVVWNRGGAPLTLSAPRDTCFCSKSEVLTPVVGPWSAGLVRTVFHSSWFSGPLEKSLLVTTDDPENPELEFTFSVAVDEDLSVAPRVHYLRDVEPGGKVTKVTTFENRTRHAVAVSGADPSGPELEVRVSGRPFAPIEIPPGGTLRAELVVSTPPVEGSYTGKVVFRVEGARPGRFPVVLSGTR